MQPEVYSRRDFINKSALLGAGLVVSHPDISKLEALSRLLQPEYGEHPYYTQFLTHDVETGSILFAAGPSVNPRALEIAREEFLFVTNFRPDIQINLATRRFLVPIIPNRTPIRSLPQFSSLTDDGLRGWGGTRKDQYIGSVRAIVAIAEENLLQLRDDQFTRAGILIAPHEYGHAIKRAGITYEERYKWINEIYPALASASNFPNNWDGTNLTFGAFVNSQNSRGEEEMFAEITRGKRQGFGPQIRSRLYSEAQNFFSNIFGPF